MTEEVSAIGTTAFYTGDIDSTWKQYGLYSATLLQGVPGNLSESPYKRINKGRNFHDPESLIAIVGREYVLLPNEEVKRIMDNLAPKYHLTLHESAFSKKGYSMFLTYLEPGEKGLEIVPGDIVKFGIMARNSINGTMGLSIDAFTMRLVCGNGAIQRTDTISTYRKHTSGLKEIVPLLESRIEAILAQSKATTLFLRFIISMELTQDLANRLSSSYIPKKYLPWKFGEETKKPDLDTLTINQTWARTATLGIPDTSLYAVYQHITGAIGHEEDTDAQSKNLYLTAFAQVVETAVEAVSAPTEGR
jgi:Domain of unknown function (DUF932)